MENNKETNSEIKKLLGLFIDNWKLIAVCAATGIVLAILSLQYIESRYKIHARVLIEDPQGNGNTGSVVGGAASKMLQDFGGFMGGSSNVNNELAVIQSRDLVESVVRKLDLNIKYYKTGAFKKEELFNNAPFKVRFLNLPASLTDSYSFSVNIARPQHLKLTSKDFTAEFNTTVAFGDTITTEIGPLSIDKTGIIPDSTANYIFTVSPIGQVVDDYVNNEITVEVTDKLASYMDIKLTSNIPAKGEAILSTLINEYIKKNVNDKNIILDSTMQFISGRVELLNNELNAVEQDIKTFKQANNLANIEEQSKVIIDQGSDYFKQLNELEVQASVIDASLQYVTDERNNKRPVPAISSVQDPNFISLLEKYNTLEVQRDHLALSNTTDNPRLQNIDVQLKNLRTDIISSLTNQKKSIEIAKRKLAAENSAINSSIKQVPAQEKTYLDLSRQQQVKQALYLYLLEKNEETAIAKSSNIASARIIETPKSDFNPYFPNKKLFIAGALVFGILSPISFVMLMSILSNKVTSMEDVEAVLPGVSTLGEISHNIKNEDNFLSETDRSVLSEQFRALRSNLRYVTGDKTCPVIMLTSSMSGEGKSFIAISLAYVYALAGKKVLLMELDLRKPKIATYLGLNSDKGFSNYIISDATIGQIIKTTPLHKNIYAISSGLIPPNPVELLINPKVKDLFEGLKKQFDIIIVDTPPIGMVTDAKELAGLSDVCLYVVRHNYTFKNQLAIIKNLKEEGRINNIYLVMNDVVNNLSSKYGYGYGYGTYSYGVGTTKR